MIKLKNLILENKQLKVEDFANVLKNAYISIFDIDEIEIIKAKDLLPPSFSHVYYTTSIHFKYKNKRYLNYHTLFYLKFPKEEIENLSHSEWMDMLKLAEKFPIHIITLELIKGNNKLISLNAGVNCADKRKKITGFEMGYNLEQIGRIEKQTNILDLVTNVKLLIDNWGGNDNNDIESPPTNPVSGIRQLAPAHD